MKDLEELRKVRRRLAQRWCGVGWDNPMITSGNAETAGKEGRLLSLPVEGKTTLLSDLAGSPLFMLGLMGLGQGFPLS
jgi:hypothetical protein